MKSNKKSVSPIAIGLGVILVLYAIILLLLLYWAIITAMKSNDDFVLGKNNFLGLPRLYYRGQGGILAPWEWEFENFANVVNFFDMKDLVRNGRRIRSISFLTQVQYTLMYSVGCSFFATLCPCIVAYATRKFNYAFNKVIDLLVIIAMTVPIIGAQASMLKLMHGLNLYDTFPGLYMQKFYFGSMYYLMFSAIFKGISKEYYEAAYIDGATELQVMVKVAIPLVLTSFGLIFLLHFITYWNDYQTLLIYAPSHPTIVYGLFKVMTDSTGSSVRGQIPVQMAGCTLITLPVIILFIIFRDKLMGNLTIGGVKE